MSTENIGGVDISVNVDLSDLDAKFQAAVAEAGADGQKIGQAIADGIGAGAETGAAAFQSAMDKLVAEGNTANEAFQKLTGSTQTFVEALQSGSLNDFADNFGKITTEAQAAAPAIEQAASAARDFNSAMAQTSGAGSSFSFGDMFSGAQDGISSMMSGLGQLDQATVVTTGDMGQLGTAIATMGGIALGIGGLKMLATDMADAADSMTRAQISLTALTGSADQAQGILAGLAQLGMSDGLSMPGLRQAAVQMEALLPAGTDIVEVLGHVADAAAVMGTSIEGLTSRFDRMVDSGTLAARSLGGMGLTMEDIQGAMESLGATTDQLADGVKKAFQNLDPEGRVMVLTEALQKFQGVAEDVANNTFGGLWQQAANTFESDMARMGDSILPFVQSALPSIKTTIDETVADLYRIKEAAQVVVDAIVGIFIALPQAIAGVGNVIADVSKGNYALAVVDAQNATDQLKTIWQGTMKEITSDVATGTQQISDILNHGITLHAVTDAVKDQEDAMKDMANAVGATIVTVSGQADSLAGHFTSATVPIVDQIRVLQQATHDFVNNVNDEISATDAAANKIDGLVQKETDLGVSVSHANLTLAAATAAMDDVKQKYADGAASFGDVELAENKVAAASTNLEAIQKKLAAAQQDVDKAFEVSGTMAAGWNEFFSQLGGEALTAGDNLKTFGLDLEGIGVDAAPQMSALNQAMADLASSSSAAKVPVEQLITDIQKLASDTSTSWEDLDRNLGIFDAAMQKTMKTDAQDAVNGLLAALGALANNNAPLAMFNQQLATTDSAIKKLSGDDINAAIAAWDQMIAKMIQAGDSIGKVLAVQAEEAQAAIKDAEATGQAADQWILKLEQVRLKQEDLKISAQGMAQASVNAINDLLKGFDQLGNAMATAIVSGKNLGDALVKEFQKIASSILADLINGALLPLKKELIELISSLLPSLNTGIGATGGAISGLAKNAQDASDAFPALTKNTESASSAMGGFSSGLTGLIGAIGAVIGAIAGIVGDVYLAAIDTKLFHVETSLVEIRNETENRRKDAWDQYNGMYDRLGECKNDLDKISDTLSQMLQTGPGGGGLGLSQTDSNNLQAMAAATQSLLAPLQTMAGDIASIDRWVQAIDTDVVNAVVTVNNTLFIVIARLDSVIAAINYHGTNQTNSLQSMALVQHAMMGGISGVGDGVNHLVQTTSDLVNQGQSMLGEGQAQLAAATTLAGEITGLENIIHGDNLLMQAALETGDTQLAQQYKAAADQASAQLERLQSGINQTVTSVNSVYDATQAASASAAQTGSFVITAIDRNASVIWNAIVAGASATAAALGAALAGFAGIINVGPSWGSPGPGFGKSPGTPSTGEGAPSNSSPGAPFIGPGGAGPGGALGPYNPGGNTPINPGSPAAGLTPGPGGIYSMVPLPPGNPIFNTGGNKDQFGNPIGGPGIPSGGPVFAEGGVMPYTGMAHLEAGEVVAPPDVSAMLRRMASTPSMEYTPRNPAASAAVPPGSVSIGSVVFNVSGGSPAENVRQIANYMKVVSPKMAALSS